MINKVYHVHANVSRVKRSFLNEKLLELLSIESSNVIRLSRGSSSYHVCLQQVVTWLTSTLYECCCCHMEKPSGVILHQITRPLTGLFDYDVQQIWCDDKKECCIIHIHSNIRHIFLGTENCLGTRLELFLLPLKSPVSGILITQ